MANNNQRNDIDFPSSSRDKNHPTSSTWWPSMGKWWYFSPMNEKPESNSIVFPETAFSPIQSFFRDDPFKHHFSSVRDVCIPKLDIIEHDNSITVKADVPGMKSSDLSIQYENDALRISGEQKTESSSNSDNYHIMERCVGKFSRSFTLPFSTSPENIHSQLNNGVLEINIPKGSAKSTNIPIN